MLQRKQNLQNALSIKGSNFIHRKIDLEYDDLAVQTNSAGLREYVTPSGVPYPSITTVLGYTADKTWIEEWQKRVGSDECARITRHATTRGSALHTLVEKYLDNKTLDFSRVMPHVKFLFDSIRPILDKNISKIYLQEFPLYSDYLKIAGRVDLIGEWNGEPAVIDFKTSSSRKKEEDIESYFMQAAFYAAAFYERTSIPITKTVILMTVDNSLNPLIFENSVFKWISKVDSASRLFNKAITR